MTVKLQSFDVDQAWKGRSRWAGIEVSPVLRGIYSVIRGNRGEDVAAYNREPLKITALLREVEFHLQPLEGAKGKEKEQYWFELCTLL